MIAQEHLMSVAEFMALPDDGNRHELVRGELRVMPPPKSIHGLVETALLGELCYYLRLKAEAAGWDPGQGRGARDRLVGMIAGVEFGLQFALPDDPTQIRGADGAFVPPAQLAEVGWDGTGYFPAVPHLVIEVLSPSEQAGDVAEKVADYLAGGARRVWYVDPERRAIYIYSASAPLRLVRGDDILTDDELLPGFALTLNQIFPD